MSGLKIFFDACVSPKFARDLVPFLERAGIHFEECIHHHDRYAEGTTDSEWLKELDDGEWLVVTADAGKRCGGDKLPKICNALGITHIVFSSYIHNMKMTEKWKAFSAVAHNIPLLHQLPKGSQVKLMIEKRKGGVEDYCLKVGGKSLDIALQKVRAKLESSASEYEDQDLL